MSDMTVSQAAAEASKWGNLIRALSKLGEVAEYLQAQEALKNERVKALETLQSEIEALTKKRDEINADNDAELKAFRERLAGIKAVEADEHKRAMDAVDAAKASLKTLADEAAAALATRTSAYEDVKRAHAELGAVQAKIAELKADAVRRFGG